VMPFRSPNKLPIRSQGDGILQSRRTLHFECRAVESRHPRLACGVAHDLD
jgi:hypothetical protein